MNLSELIFLAILTVCLIPLFIAMAVRFVIALMQMNEVKRAGRGRRVGDAARSVSRRGRP